MIKRFSVDVESSVPIYQQLVDEIRIGIKKGDIPAGSQLPTVLQMADAMGLARGTIKRAYDELELMGLVEKVQGRGTFVCYRKQTPESRKEQAMQAIDIMLDQMAGLGFSPAEVNIFLNLKLRERAQQRADMKVAVVECNPENLSQLSDQLRNVEGVELYSYLISHVQAYPYNLGEEMDLIVTTVEHAPYIQSVVSDQKKIARVALRLSPKSMAQIVKLRSEDSVGVMGCSHRFADLLHEACVTYTECAKVDEPRTITADFPWDNYLKGKTVILVPEGFEKHTDPQGIERLNRFAERGRMIRCAYEMDEGSLLYLQEKISRFRDKKMS